ncbi:MAG: glycosyltransferase [Anaerolineales bacterium]|nr:glycosyltransferase [Anaerolineales bacterium]NUQ85627.1 glycosyltransferase family 1 protein [Anaerolineales bacterium]
MKTITLLTSGTRGDVIPYMALGLGLRDAGYNVRIAAPIGFQSLIEPSGLTFAPFEGNPSDLMIDQSDPLTVGRNLFRSLDTTRKFLAQARTIYPRMLQTAMHACRGSDAVVYGLPALWGAHIAEGLRVPGIRAALQPLTPTREFASALLPFRFDLSGIGNWFSHWILIQGAWLSFRREINRARRTHFGLPRAHWLDPSLRPFPHQPLTLNGFSEYIVPRPKDWNEKQIITGYWQLSTEEWMPPLELESFIERSPHNTIAIGLGSPGAEDFIHFINVIERALTRSDARAVLTIPSRYHPQIRSNNILPIEYAPHEWLYQLVRAAVHHGGAGTTSAGLHAGIPMVTLPLAIDQFFWGERAYKIGVAAKPIPQRALNAEKLSAAIRTTLWDESMRERAKGISAALSLEDGVQVAVSQMRGVV